LLLTDENVIKHCKWANKQKTGKYSKWMWLSHSKKDWNKVYAINNLEISWKRSMEFIVKCNLNGTLECDKVIQKKAKMFFTLLKLINYLFMSGSCHLNCASIVEIGVECRIFVTANNFYNYGHIQGIIRVH
jgi:hypothetical protein